MPTEIPHIPVELIEDPTSTDLTDTTNEYPLLEDITVSDSVGPEAGNRQPRALDARTESLRDRLNKMVDIVNDLTTNLVHRDGDAATPASFMRGNLSMTDTAGPTAYRVINVADGTGSQDAVSKTQLDSLQTFLTSLQTDLNDYLRRDGTNAMTSDLDAGGNTVINMADPVNVQDGVTKGYADTNFSTIQTGFLRRDGTLAMQGSLNMGGNKIVNLDLATPTEDGDAVSRSFLLATLANIAETPTGTIVYFAGDVTVSGPPTGYALCDGSAVSRTDALYTALNSLMSAAGYPFGNGDGSTTFNLPDFRGRVAIGLDNMGGSSANVVTDSQADSLGGTLGAEEVTLTTPNLPAHQHSFTDQYTDGSGGGAETGPATTDADNTLNTVAGTTGSAGSDQAHNNVQPCIAMNALIKL